jgi:hypothetical protein
LAAVCIGLPDFVNDAAVQERETNKIMYELIKQKYNSPDFMSYYFGYLMIKVLNRNFKP